jgi:hypothetical protein
VETGLLINLYIKHLIFEKKNILLTCILAHFYSKCVGELRDKIARAKLSLIKTQGMG